MLLTEEYYNFIKRNCEDGFFMIPGYIGTRGKVMIIKRDLSNEIYKKLKIFDETFYELNRRHAFANFLPDDIRPKDVYVPVFDDEDK